MQQHYRGRELQAGIASQARLAHWMRRHTHAFPEVNGVRLVGLVDVHDLEPAGLHRLEVVQQLKLLQVQNSERAQTSGPPAPVDSFALPTPSYGDGEMLPASLYLDERGALVVADHLCPSDLLPSRRALVHQKHRHGVRPPGAAAAGLAVTV